MEDSTHSHVTQGGRIRKGLMVFCALVLFLAGLLLLLAPASAQDGESICQPAHFLGGANGWIMGAQSHQPGSAAGS